jgi:hypothetical protein
MTESRRMKLTELLALKGEWNACRMLVRKLEENRPLGRPKREWLYDIKMNVREILEWYGLV